MKEDNISIHEDEDSRLTKKTRALARLENYNAPGLKESTSSFTSDDTEEIYFLAKHQKALVSMVPNKRNFRNG